MVVGDFVLTGKGFVYNQFLSTLHHLLFSLPCGIIWHLLFNTHLHTIRLRNSIHALFMVFNEGGGETYFYELLMALYFF